MFELVEHVEAYPQFLPWCGGTEVQERSAEGMVATIRIDYRGVRQAFTTQNCHEYGRRIRMTLREGPFSRLNGDWQFLPLGEQASKVVFTLDYVFAGALLSRVLAPVFGQITANFVDAFVRRAESLYG